LKMPAAMQPRASGSSSPGCCTSSATPPPRQSQTRPLLLLWMREPQRAGSDATNRACHQHKSCTLAGHSIIVRSHVIASSLHSHPAAHLRSSTRLSITAALAFIDSAVARCSVSSLAVCNSSHWQRRRDRHIPARQDRCR
jgi:hypothetical protein